MRRLLLVLVMMVLPGAAQVSADKPFDPKSDAVADLAAAERQAAALHKNILLDVGGNWCRPCLLLERTIEQNTELKAARERYVLVRVPTGLFAHDSATTAAVLKRYPSFVALPHLFVLRADGTLLHDQTETFADDAKHEVIRRDKVLGFLRHWVGASGK